MNIKFWENKDNRPAIFELHRLEDKSGISGIGHVLDGVVFPDGTTVVKWKTNTSSVAIFRTFRQFEKVHVAYHGESEIRWVDGFDGIGFTLSFLGRILKSVKDTQTRNLLSTKITELGRLRSGRVSKYSTSSVLRPSEGAESYEGAPEDNRSLTETQG